MVEISLSGSGEGPGRVTDRGYSTALFSIQGPIEVVMSTAPQPFLAPRQAPLWPGARALASSGSSIEWRRRSLFLKWFRVPFAL